MFIEKLEFIDFIEMRQGIVTGKESSDIHTEITRMTSGIFNALFNMLELLCLKEKTGNEVIRKEIGMILNSNASYILGTSIVPEQREYVYRCFHNFKDLVEDKCEDEACFRIVEQIESMCFGKQNG